MRVQHEGRLRSPRTFVSFKPKKNPFAVAKEINSYTLVSAGLQSRGVLGGFRWSRALIAVFSLRSTPEHLGENKLRKSLDSCKPTHKNTVKVLSLILGHQRVRHEVLEDCGMRGVVFDSRGTKSEFAGSATGQYHGGGQ